ncbi:MAG: hypothetical protein M3R36_10360 [Bacteroidota bacterium]|nr:hypothetical protein [Bacteroidota bacterium]
MKKLSLAILFLASTFLISCQDTNKQSNKTGNPDTIVVKKDTAIKRSDTTGFGK